MVCFNFMKMKNFFFLLIFIILSFYFDPCKAPKPLLGKKCIWEVWGIPHQIFIYCTQYIWARFTPPLNRELSPKKHNLWGFGFWMYSYRTDILPSFGPIYTGRLISLAIFVVIILQNIVKDHNTMHSRIQIQIGLVHICTNPICILLHRLSAEDNSQKRKSGKKISEVSPFPRIEATTSLGIRSISLPHR